MNNENIISKGFYRFPQVKDFISVKNHMFMRCDDKVCLAIRFSNDTEYTFDYFSFDIVELNAEGKPIGKVFVEYKDISFAPGSVFASDKALAVSNNCVDFRIEFHEAFSGAYKYVVRRGKASVYYNRRKTEIHSTKEDAQKRRTADVRVTQRREGKPFLSAFLIILSIVIMAALTARYLYSDFQKEQGIEEDSWFAALPQDIDDYEEAGVIYAEI